MIAVWVLAAWVLGVLVLSAGLLLCASAPSRRGKRRHVPGLPRDGKPLSGAEHERFRWIADGNREWARALGRKR